MSESSSREKCLIEQRIIQLSNYCNMIQRILAESKSLSVVKLWVLSFLLKYRENNVCAFDGRTRKDVLTKATCDAAGRFMQLVGEMPYFYEALALVIKDGAAIYRDGLVFVAVDRSDYPKFSDSFSKKLVRDCALLSDDLVAMEVLRNV